MKFKPRHDNPTVRMLAHCIQELEIRTEAEVVLVIRRASGLYRDVDYGVGALLAFGVLLFKLYSPYEFDPLSVPLPLLIAFAMGARLSHVSGRYGPRRYLTTSRRRESQVRHAAAGCFFDKKIDRLETQAGILLYFSALEQRAELICGERARRALEPKLEELRAQLQNACGGERTIRGSVGKLGEFLRTFGVYLGQVFPCGKPGHKNVLDDRPDLGGEEV